MALESALVHFASWLVPRLSRRAVLALARGSGQVAFCVDYRGRRTGRENLRVVFPEKSAAWREAVLLRSYQSFARTALDLFWSVNLTAETWSAWQHIQNDDPGTEAVAAAHGALWCAPHFGNFEWMAVTLAWRGFPMTVVAQDFKNPALTPVVNRFRSHSGNAIIPSEGAMLKLFKNLKRGGHSAFLCDLTVKPDQAATVVRCFGLKMSTTVLHAALSQRTGLPVIPLMSIPQPDGTYLMRQWPPQFFAPHLPVREIAQRLWDLFEPVIRQQPEHWLWMYKHWRFLPADPEGREYPAYANRSKKFDALERREGGDTDEEIRDKR